MYPLGNAANNVKRYRKGGAKRAFNWVTDLTAESEFSNHSWIYTRTVIAFKKFSQ